MALEEDREIGKIGRSLTDLDVQKTVNHGGGSIMIWGCMTWDGMDGVGYATLIENGLDAPLYREILGDELMGTLEYYHMDKNSIIFHHIST